MTFPYKGKTYFKGTYEVIDNKVVESEDLKSITTLTENYFTYITSNPKTLETLYRCKTDNSYWLLSYEKQRSEGHGSGNTYLKRIIENEAKRFFEKHK